MVRSRGLSDSRGLRLLVALRVTTRLVVTCAVALAAGCVLSAPKSTCGDPVGSVGLPGEGARTRELRAFYGIPILNKSAFWDGNGEDDTAGIQGRQFWHLTDRIALGAGLTGAAFFQSGADAFAAEAEAIGRYYVYRSESLGVFTELTGGWMQSTHPVPTGGTEWNMTFSFAGGVEVPLDDGLNLLTGVTYHHVSNALGREHDRNPSQNEARIWIGLGFRL